MNTKQQLKEAREFAQHYKDMCTEKNIDIDNLRTQLAKANERVRELEWALSNLDDYLSNKNKFAIENQIKGAFSFANYLDKSNFSAAIAAKESGFFQLVETFGQQLRKEQNQC